MTKNRHFKILLIAAPPIILVAVGLGVYIAIAKILAPELDTISAVPDTVQSSSSATPLSTEASPSAVAINPISTQVTQPEEAELHIWQSDADDGKDTWRLDPLSTAEQQAGMYGFLPGDQLTLVTDEDTSNQALSKKATVIALHGGQAYILTMIQPQKTGPTGIWVIESIEGQT